MIQEILQDCTGLFVLTVIFDNDRFGHFTDCILTLFSKSFDSARNRRMHRCGNKASGLGNFLACKYPVADRDTQFRRSSDMLRQQENQFFSRADPL